MVLRLFRVYLAFFLFRYMWIITNTEIINYYQYTKKLTPKTYENIIQCSNDKKIEKKDSII